MKTPVIANMATFPARIKALKQNLEGIMPQVDVLNIYLNNYDYVPGFLNHPKINAMLSGDHAGDLGDVGKFYLCRSWHKLGAYIFTMDDKLIYPRDYVEKSIEKIKQYNHRAVISYHGRNLKKNCSSYYFDPGGFFGVLGCVPIDRFVHELGTGAMFFHSKLIKCDPRCFKHTNMTDIYFSMFLQRQRIPLLVASHESNWVKIAALHNDQHSIHSSLNKDDRFQTKTVNDFHWQIFSL